MQAKIECGLDVYENSEFYTTYDLGDYLITVFINGLVTVDHVASGNEDEPLLEVQFFEPRDLVEESIREVEAIRLKSAVAVLAVTNLAVLALFFL